MAHSFKLCWNTNFSPLKRYHKWYGKFSDRNDAGVLYHCASIMWLELWWET